MPMTLEEADAKLDECVDFIEQKFGGEAAFGVVIVVPIGVNDAEMAFSGTMEMQEAHDVLCEYLEAENNDDDDDEQQEVVPGNTLN